MEVRSPLIVDELRVLQSPLATWPVAMPFRVPEAYFPAFPEHLRLVLEAEESVDIVPAFGIVSLPLAVPEGYFESFTANLAEVLEDAAIEDTFSRENAFLVPEGYFDGVADAVLAAVQPERELPVSLTRKNAFTVPDGYFDGVADAVLTAIAEIEETPATWSRENVLSVPEEYFDNFAAQLQTRIAAEESPKTIPLRPRRLIPIQVMRWAAAAALVVGVFAGIRNADAPTVASATTQRALAAIPEGAIQAYIVQHMDDFDGELLETQLPPASFEQTSPVRQLETREIQSFLTEETLL